MVVRTSWNRNLRWGGQTISVPPLRFIASGLEGSAFFKSFVKAHRFSQTRHCWRRPRVEVNTVWVMEGGGILTRLHWSRNLGLHLRKFLVVYLCTTAPFINIPLIQWGAMLLIYMEIIIENSGQHCLWVATATAKRPWTCLIKQTAAFQIQWSLQIKVHQ